MCMTDYDALKGSRSFLLRDAVVTGRLTRFTAKMESESHEAGINTDPPFNFLTYLQCIHEPLH